MRLILLTFLSLICGSSLKSQEINELNKIGREYKLKKIIEYNYEALGIWKSVYFFETNRIIKIKVYSNNRLMHRKYFKYDSLGNISSEVYKTGKYEFNKNYNNSYNKKGQLVYSNGKNYSNFTEGGLPRKIESLNFNFSFEYRKMDLILKKEFRKKDNIEIVDLYKYSNNNLMEIVRDFNGDNEKYPIVMLGGPTQYKIEKFRYEYNSDGLWKKMYKIINNKEFLIRERKFRK